ncbi:MAG: transcriptional regulator [Desulfuromonadaceae bacterium]|nr:transcriptional regulator [Desulfuromonadaceae bacterium]MDD2848465.1 transcriptional regulator [Desulfuromonadaceae bacterium]MDD4129906.1 transcriptional regulator [Desulfuromonadaceae bacterium]
MIRFLVIGLLFYIGYRILASLGSAKKPLSSQSGSRDHGVDTYRDPVCGVYVTEETAIIGRLDGQRHYFCSMNCLEKYREQLDHSSPSNPEE